MSKADILQLLGWCSLVHIVILMLWVLMFRFAHTWVYSIHNKWIEISEEKFNQTHYALMGFYKLIVIVFFLIPYLVLRAI